MVQLIYQTINQHALNTEMPIDQSAMQSKIPGQYFLLQLRHGTQVGYCIFNWMYGCRI